MQVENTYMIVRHKSKRLAPNGGAYQSVPADDIFITLRGITRFMRFFPVVMLLCLSFACSAQVYTFKPAYSVKLTYGGGDMDELWFEKIDKTSLSTFTVDLGNKTITVPDYVTPKPIEKITRDEKNNTIILKMKGNKDVGMVWCYYEMKFNPAGDLVYIQQVERLTGKRFAEDTFFHMYTNDLKTLSLSRKCKSVKSNMALSADSAMQKAEMKELFNTRCQDGENSVVLRNGYINWTEGRGRKATEHHFRVDSVTALDEDGMKGALFRCSAEEGYFTILYISTKRNLDPSQYSWSRFIIIDKYEDRKRKWSIVMR